MTISYLGAKRKPFAFSAIVNGWSVLRSWLDRWVAEWQRQLLDQEIQRELDKLSEFHLNDIGIKRYPHRVVRVDLGRGAPPITKTEFEYRPIEISDGARGRDAASR
jgi:uncharacterized protein YjiS (DUF1127 family)